MTTPTRCGWVNTDPLYIQYHDEEWGVPVYDDRKLFEMLCLEGAQAGLSWYTILQRREGYRIAFDGFDPVRMAAYDDAKREALLQDARIIRNRAKVKAFVQNANAFLQVQAEFGTFSAYIWQFVGGTPKVNCPVTLHDLPAETEESRAMSKALKKRGFGFIGPTICYAFMQACGLVNDHTTTCFRADCN
jgi:DNA-3-methyladenine glycosylase I